MGLLVCGAQQDVFHLGTPQKLPVIQIISEKDHLHLRTLGDGGILAELAETLRAGNP